MKPTTLKLPAVAGAGIEAWHYEDGTFYLVATGPEFTRRDARRLRDFLTRYLDATAPRRRPTPPRGTRP
jgi:hypothetical protein